MKSSISLNFLLSSVSFSFLIPSTNPSFSVFFFKRFLKASFQTPVTSQAFHESPAVQISTSRGKNRRYLFMMQGSRAETL